MLKHFAAASVAFTIVLATFAGGDEVGVGAQIDARQKKNELVAVEQEKLGTRKIGTTLHVRGEKAGFSEDEGADSGFGGGSGGGGGGGSAPSAIRPHPTSPWQSTPPGMTQAKPRTAPMKRGAPILPDGPSDENSDSNGPSASNTASLIEASRARSGNSGESGD